MGYFSTTFKTMNLTDLSTAVIPSTGNPGILGMGYGNSHIYLIGNSGLYTDNYTNTVVPITGLNNLFSVNGSAGHIYIGGANSSTNAPAITIDQGTPLVMGPGTGYVTVVLPYTH